MKIHEVVAKYPKLVDEFHPGKPVRLGLRKGWAKLLDETLKNLFDSGWDGHFSQIKQKFGGLRIYISGLNPVQQDIVSGAEKASYTICEFCGKPANAQKGWNTTCGDAECTPGGLNGRED